MNSQAENKYKLRVYYKKLGILAYLSHLELCRAIEYTIRRANLPYAVTQGFSPHMKVSFGRALGVGIESYCQVFDVILYEKIGLNDIKSRLEKCFPNNFEFVSCEYIDIKASTCSNIFTKFCYEVTLDEQIENLEIPKTIDVTRKKKTRTINVADFLDNNKVNISCYDNKCKLMFCLQTKSSGSLKPLEFIDALFKMNNLNKAIIKKITLVSCF